MDRCRMAPNKIPENKILNDSTGFRGGPVKLIGSGTKKTHPKTSEAYQI